MAQFAGIVCATPLIGALGLRRSMAAAALMFGLTALGAAVIAELAPTIVLRALQEFAAGGFGPMAFVATFTTSGGPRLPFGLSLLALVLLLPVGFGLAASGLLLEAFGWQGLFLVQSAIGAGLAIAAILFMPRAPVNQVAVTESQRPQLIADVQAAEAELRLALIDLESTVVRAPTDGRVAERQARKGQFVRPGTQLIALVSQDVWVVANLKETELKDMRVGEPVAVTVDALPGRIFAGRVESLSPASGAQFALLQPDNATGNFTRIVQRIPIRITFLPGQPGHAELRPGMSAKVRR